MCLKYMFKILMGEHLPHSFHPIVYKHIVSVHYALLTISESLGSKEILIPEN